MCVFRYIYIYIYITESLVWQKSTPRCESTVLQYNKLKMFLIKKTS